MRTLRIALIAHDHKKQDLVDWALTEKVWLSTCELFATGTTGERIHQATGLPIHLYKSGPHGGDLQIGARIAEGGLDVLIFFWDPLAPQPHDVDVKALLRIAALYDLPTAHNRATALLLV